MTVHTITLLKKDRGRPRVKRIGKFLSVHWQIFNGLEMSLFRFPSRKSRLRDLCAREMYETATECKFCPDVSVILKVAAPASLQVSITGD